MLKAEKKKKTKKKKIGDGKSTQVAEDKKAKKEESDTVPNQAVQFALDWMADRPEEPDDGRIRNRPYLFVYGDCTREKKDGSCEHAIIAFPFSEYERQEDATWTGSQCLAHAVHETSNHPIPAILAHVPPAPEDAEYVHENIEFEEQEVKQFLAKGHLEFGQARMLNPSREQRQDARHHIVQLWVSHKCFVKRKMHYHAIRMLRGDGSWTTGRATVERIEKLVHEYGLVADAFVFWHILERFGDNSHVSECVREFHMSLFCDGKAPCSHEFAWRLVDKEPKRGVLSAPVIVQLAVLHRLPFTREQALHLQPYALTPEHKMYVDSFACSQDRRDYYDEDWKAYWTYAFVKPDTNKHDRKDATSVVVLHLHLDPVDVYPPWFDVRITRLNGSSTDKEQMSGEEVFPFLRRHDLVPSRRILQECGYLVDEHDFDDPDKQREKEEEEEADAIREGLGQLFGTDE